MSDQLFLKNSILYGYWDHSDTRKRLVNGSSSLDLGAEKCDSTAVVAVEPHFLRKYDFAILRHTDMILFWLKRQNMIIILRTSSALIFLQYWAVSGNRYLGPGLAVNGNTY